MVDSQWPKAARPAAALGTWILFLLAMLVSIFIVRASESGGAAILLPWQLGVGIFFLTILMCVSAAIVSINKVTSLDPAMVFKG